MAAIKREILCSPVAPKPVGPYSHAVAVGNTVYVYGTIGLDPKRGGLAPGGIEGEADQALNNLRAVLVEADCGMKDVVKTTVMLSDISNMDKFNEVYKRYFKDKLPARTAFATPALPMGGLVEIDAIAVKGILDV